MALVDQGNIAPYTVASIQMSLDLMDVTKNVEHSHTLIKKAAALGAKLIVLPELCNTGYMIPSLKEAGKVAESIPEGYSCKAWTEMATKYQVYIVAGLLEKADKNFFNSSVIIGPNGLVGTYRKVHLWDKENEIIAEGNTGFPVFETALGRIGMLICYDNWFSEGYHCLAKNGAEIVCMPTNWVPLEEPLYGQLPMANILAMSSAHKEALYIVAANRIGTESGQEFIGHSVVVGPNGRALAGPASCDQEETLLATIDLNSRPLALGSSATKTYRSLNYLR